MSQWNTVLQWPAPNTFQVSEGITRNSHELYLAIRVPVHWGTQACPDILRGTVDEAKYLLKKYGFDKA